MVVTQELSLANEHDYKSTLIERAAHVFSRITSYNVCYTKLLRLTISSLTILFNSPKSITIPNLGFAWSLSGSPITVTAKTYECP